ncbi:PREDICTED: uncharacterized protein LOC108382280 [Rhagoletis zephyria]|uniref:uncharacterized protein LOC108382280 n=1 Tax=Rhagoletis zephyria TaxID=28612 RepID=UPI0008114E28|nr:PREDICTED: uncharacterized protein LOC108382280 [Rhagoletis zephyria]
MNEFKKLRKILMKQNAMVVETLTNQSSLIKRIIRHETVSSEVIDEFPINNQEELIDLDSKINKENRDGYVAAIKTLIRNQIQKNIKNVLAESVIVDFNLDGTHGKGRLKDYKDFYCVLREAVESDEPDKCIRQAMQNAKKRHFQAVSAYNKKVRVIVKAD